MNGSAPKGNLQYPDRHIKNLHGAVATEASKVTGQRIKPADVNPNDQSPLEKIQEALGDPTHVIGSTAEAAFLGESSTTNDRAAKGRIAIEISSERNRRRKGLLSRLGLRKAA